MTQGDMILLWQQRQEYLATKQFEEGQSFVEDPPYCEDAYISEEERWEELCQQQQSQPRS